MPMMANPANPIAIENSAQKLRPVGTEPISRRNNGVNVSSKYTPIQNVP
jgi:hypothetical protein